MPAATVDYSQRICEVWACNMDEEMKKIRQVIQKYNYIAMDTEFLKKLKIELPYDPTILLLGIYPKERTSAR
uniref:CCR4-NOT transcription complex subunit 7 n=1 Tax=Colobus angolensis palliatus TaxID=336983 RepID=A0A2K5IPC8_COLAP